MPESVHEIGTGLRIDDALEIIYDTVDPSAGSGKAAPISSQYHRTTDGTIWRKTGASDTAWSQLLDTSGSSTEDGHQNGFMGKSGLGEEYPQYSSTNVVTSDTTGTAGDGNNLEEAIGQLDSEIGPAVTPESRTNNPISDQPINENIEELDSAIGNDAQHTSTDHTVVGNSVMQNISALDAAISDSEPIKVSLTNQPSGTTVADSVAHANVELVEWHVKVQSTSTSSKKRSRKITALTDGTSVDRNSFARNRLGGAISGLSFDVNINGANLELQISHTEAVDISLSRITVAA